MGHLQTRFKQLDLSFMCRQVLKASAASKRRWLTISLHVYAGVCPRSNLAPCAIFGARLAEKDATCTSNSSECRDLSEDLGGAIADCTLAISTVLWSTATNGLSNLRRLLMGAR